MEGLGSGASLQPSQTTKNSRSCGKTAKSHGNPRDHGHINRSSQTARPSIWPSPAPRSHQATSSTHYGLPELLSTNPLAHFSTQQYLSRYLAHFVHFNPSMLSITALFSFTFRQPGSFLHSCHLVVAFIDTQLASVT